MAGSGLSLKCWPTSRCRPARAKNLEFFGFRNWELGTNPVPKSGKCRRNWILQAGAEPPVPKMGVSITNSYSKYRVNRGLGKLCLTFSLSLPLCPALHVK
jgi:hypothetical protein